MSFDFDVRTSTILFLHPQQPAKWEEDQESGMLWSQVNHVLQKGRMGTLSQMLLSQQIGGRQRGLTFGLGDVEVIVSCAVTGFKQAM